MPQSSQPLDGHRRACSCNWEHGACGLENILVSAVTRLNVCLMDDVGSIVLVRNYDGLYKLRTADAKLFIDPSQFKLPSENIARCTDGGFGSDITRPAPPPCYNQGTDYTCSDGDSKFFIRLGCRCTRVHGINCPDRSFEPKFSAIFWKVKIYCREDQYTAYWMSCKSHCRKDLDVPKTTTA